MTDHLGILCINILEIHKPILLQFSLLSGVFIDTAFKKVRKGIENVAENRGYIKVRCKSGLSVKNIHDEICVIYGDKQMSFSIVCRQFTKFSSGQESVKDAPYSGRLRSAVSSNKIKSIVEKDEHFTVRQRARMTNLGLASIHFILQKILKVTKISARWIPHLLTDEQKHTGMQMAQQLLMKYLKYQKKGV